MSEVSLVKAVSLVFKKISLWLSIVMSTNLKKWKRSSCIRIPVTDLSSQENSCKFQDLRLLHFGRYLQNPRFSTKYSRNNLKRQTWIISLIFLYIQGDFADRIQLFCVFTPHENISPQHISIRSLTKGIIVWFQLLEAYITEKRKDLPI